MHTSVMTRRTALRSLAGLVGGATLGVTSRARATSASIVVVSGGGSYEQALRKAILEPFERDTKIQVIYQSPMGDARVKAQVESGNVQWDVVELTGLAFRPDAGRLLEEIDYDVFDKETLAALDPEARSKYAVGSYTFSTVMSFSTRDWPAGKPRPRTWAEFWDAKQFPGPRTLRTAANGDPGTIEFALLAAGVPKNKLYPLDLDKAFASLDKIKPHIAKWWSAGAEPGQLLVDRQVTLASGFNGRMELLKKQGAPVDYHWNEAELSPNHWGVPKGTRNKAAAMKFLAYASTAQSQARLNNVIFYGPFNRKAFDYIDPKVGETLPTAPANREKQFLRDYEWLEAIGPSRKTNVEIMIDRWVQWVVR
jgi:putative spermidine/putrescine transport system substrate-binding protein